jgi:hypothetical protein
MQRVIALLLAACSLLLIAPLAAAAFYALQEAVNLIRPRNDAGTSISATGVAITMIVVSTWVVAGTPPNQASTADATRRFATGVAADPQS